MYSSGEILNERPTGGQRRFLELTTQLSYTDSVCLTFVSQDKDVDNILFPDHLILENPPRKKIYKLFPPEMRILLSNTKIIKQLKKMNYDKIVVFDVPPAVGLVLYRFKNMVLMIRKDMIGYERTINKRWTLYPKLVFMWFCETLCMINCCRIICQCNYDKKILKKRHPLIAEIIDRKTKILINNVNPSWIVNNKEKGANEFTLSEKRRFRVCFIGNFDIPRKGHELLLDAAEDILKKDNNIEFVLIGGGESLDFYRLKYENNDIVFTGKLNNPDSVLRQCDLLVVPSYADSCPNTVMEALFNGIPVIGSRAGGIPEILLDDNSLFDLNVKDLSEKICCLKNDKERLIQIQERQKERCTELTFDWGNAMMNLIVE